jgi:hypothetical protein
MRVSPLPLAGEVAVSAAGDIIVYRKADDKSLLGGVTFADPATDDRAKQRTPRDRAAQQRRRPSDSQLALTEARAIIRIGIEREPASRACCRVLTSSAPAHHVSWRLRYGVPALRLSTPYVFLRLESQSRLLLSSRARVISVVDDGVDGV